MSNGNITAWMLGSAAAAIGFAPILNDIVLTREPYQRGQAKRRNKSTYFERNGKREVARRLRQIESGQLTKSNGLMEA